MTKEETKTTEKKSNKNLIVIIVVALIVLVGLGLLGRYIAKKVAQKATSTFLSGMTGQNVNVGSNGKDITVKTDKGELSINSNGQVPNDFPKDFPIYPGAKVTGSFSTSGTGEDKSSKGVSVVWETGDGPAKVGAYYKSELVKAGYTIVTEYSQGDNTTLTFEKGSVSGFMGVAAGDGGKTAISVTVGSK